VALRVTCSWLSAGELFVKTNTHRYHWQNPDVQDQDRDLLNWLSRPRLKPRELSFRCTVVFLMSLCELSVDSSGCVVIRLTNLENSLLLEMPQEDRLNHFLAELKRTKQSMLIVWFDDYCDANFYHLYNWIQHQHAPLWLPTTSRKTISDLYLLSLAASSQNSQIFGDIL